MFRTAHGSHRSPLPPAAPTVDATSSPRAPHEPRPAPPASAQPAPAAAAAAAPKQRDAFFDNAKYLAIVFVAMGHAWEPLTDGSRAAEALYMIVYTFHMPAFIVIS
ncbi:hypothetical protein GTW43_08790, partial [Streptomyces sp. SID5785]|nr:hypothetical protein [Streptomyces sp. SID5785]